MSTQSQRDMARTPVSDRPLVAQWLIQSRKRFENPATKRPWSAEHFLEELRAAGGWAPNIANYAQWESGEVTPREENLRPVIEFYAARGIAGPAQPPAPEPALDLPRALMALARELEALREERQSLAGQVRELQAMVAAHDLRLRSAPSAGGSASPAALESPAQ